MTASNGEGRSIPSTSCEREWFNTTTCSAFRQSLRLARILDRHRSALLPGFLLSGLRRLDFSSTAMARALHIVIRRHSWDYDKRAFSQLLGASQHDFGVPVIILDRALDFDLTSFKLADVSHFFYIG